MLMVQKESQDTTRAMKLPPSALNSHESLVNYMSVVADAATAHINFPEAKNKISRVIMSVPLGSRYSGRITLQLVSSN